MTARRALAGLAIASLLVAGACRRRTPDVGRLPESNHVYELSIGRDDGRDANVAARPAAPPLAPAGNSWTPPTLLTEQPLSEELRTLVARGHAHPAVGSLEAAGCDLALVMTGEDHARFFDLRRAAKYNFEMEPVPFERRTQVVECQTLTQSVDCVALAPIFARVARPTRQFHVYSGSDPPFNARCAGTHDRKGKSLGGEGPGYPSTARL